MGCTSTTASFFSFVLIIWEKNLFLKGRNLFQFLNKKFGYMDTIPGNALLVLKKDTAQVFFNRYLRMIIKM